MFRSLLLFLLGLTSLATGIALVTNAQLGTSAISSLAFVLAQGTGLSMGLFVFATNAFFYFVQIAVDPTQILLKAAKQLPVCALFGFVIDAAMRLTAGLVPDFWWQSLAMTLSGTVLMGFGVSAMVFSRFLILPPEGTVLAVLKRWGGSFGTLRAGVDVLIVTAALGLSFALFGEIRGVREGTVVCALLTGPVAKQFLLLWGYFFPQHKVLG